MKEYQLIQLDSETNIFEILVSIAKKDQLFWKLLWIRAVSTPKINILEVEKNVNTSKHGIAISMSELKHLFNNLLDLQELLLIGDFEKSHLQRYAADEIMWNTCAVSIEKIDSSYWIITSRV